MSEQEKLVPVFMPSLAEVLAAAEKKKGTPLTAAEIEAIRDQSPCIMMGAADVQLLQQKRGFVDVNPENYWADWHRLRAQMVGKGWLAKIILCIPGDADLRSRCKPILDAAGIAHEFRSHENNLLRSFQASSMAWPSISNEDFEGIARHDLVLYVLSDNLTSAAAPIAGETLLKLGKKLLDAGGIAIKCDSSGISHSSTRWAKFVEHASLDAYNKWSALFHAYVIFPIGSKSDLYSCGMHLLGAPDLIVAQLTIQEFAAAGESASAAAKLFRAFGVYLVAECPVGSFTSGHTFSVAAGAPRYRVEWEPCDGYPEDSFFFNPFGRWRFVRP